MVSEMVVYEPSTPPAIIVTNDDDDVDSLKQDIISISSSSADDQLFACSNAVALQGDHNKPTFGNIAVSNSSEIHFGNKTYYQGPVTIKKIVYAGAEAPSEEAIGDDVVNISNGKIDIGRDGNCAIGDNKLKKTQTLPGTLRKSSFREIKPLSVLHIFGADLYTEEPLIQQWTPRLRDESFKDCTGEITFKLFFTLSVGKEITISLFDILLGHNKPLLITVLVGAIVITVGILLLVFLRDNSISTKYSSDSSELDNRTPIDNTIVLESNLPFNLVTRIEWVAQPPTRRAPALKKPTPLVIIHQTDTDNCTTMGDCIFIVRFMQTFHIESQQSWDISYNFLVGGDGNVYEGRGWSIEGAHTFNFNARSIGIALIGSFEDTLPTDDQLTAMWNLLSYGAKERHLATDYKLIDSAELPPQKIKIISRREWLAKSPKEPLDKLPTPVPYIIIMHSATDNCTDQASCTFSVKNIQKFHMDSRKWWDIGYNFLVGGDGYVYEGRGWTSEGSHTLYYNKNSIGIAFVGTFTNYLPPKRQITAALNLIRLGVNESYVLPDYKLLAARQVSSTESPGLLLFEKVKTWPHWVKEP